jgi:hypothetical protein
MQFSLASVVRSRSRLWRVDAQVGDVLSATAIDGGDRQGFYIPFEEIQPAQLDLPSPDVVGHIQSQDLLLHGTPAQVAAAARYAMEAGVRMIGPECAIPLRTPLENLKAVVQGVEDAV